MTLSQRYRTIFSGGGRSPNVCSSALLFLLSVAAAAGAAPEAELWPRWEKHDPDSTAIVDHSQWDEFLGKYLGDKEGVTVVDYGAVGDSDKGMLNAYLDMLSATDVASLNRHEQRAFWINLYNALTVKVIIDNFPVDSIRDIYGSLFSPGPWGEKLVSVAGEKLALNDIEHRILRPIWLDERIHYAVNCASIGCPNLSGEAFTAQNTEQLLEGGAHAYINHERGANVDNGKLVVSSIYDWFKVDFGGNDAGVIAHLKKYAQQPLRGELEELNSIADNHYNWSLNQP